MSQISEPETKHNDVIDLVIEAAQKVVTVKNENGENEQKLMIDPKTVFYKTQIVNSPTFSRFVYVLESFLGLSEIVFFNMVTNRADVISKQIQKKYEAYCYSIDAKSSESVRNKDNTQSTLIDKINRNKIEKNIHLKSDKGTSAIAAIFGKKETEELD